MKVGQYCPSLSEVLLLPSRRDVSGNGRAATAYNQTQHNYENEMLLSQNERVKIQILFSASFPVSHTFSLPAPSIVHFAKTGYSLFDCSPQRYGTETMLENTMFAQYLNQAIIACNFVLARREVGVP